MLIWQDFHFLRPGWLWLLLLVIPVVWLIKRSLSQSSDWRKICDPHLINHLIQGQHQRQHRYPFALLSLAWVLVILALAGPTWERLPQPVYSSIQGRVIVFDLSQSMNSSDLPPSRLVRAKFKLTDLLSQEEGLQQALVVFAGDAFVVTPLTDDTATILNLIPALDTKTVPIQGSRSDLGLAKAVELFENTGLDQGEIILITDGVSPETTELAEEIAEKGYRLSVIGVGTQQGAPVVLESGELLKDRSGNIVIPKLQPASLSQIARSGKGGYSPLTADNSDIQSITIEDTFPQWDNQDQSEQRLKGDQWADYGVWLMIPILLLTVTSFRKGWIFGLSLLFLTQATMPSLPQTMEDKSEVLVQSLSAL